jgi:glycyl-tRNA synthetase alpha chain
VKGEFAFLCGDAREIPRSAKKSASLGMTPTDWKSRITLLPRLPTLRLVADGCCLLPLQSFILQLEFMNPSNSNPLTFQKLLLELQTFWAERGCVLQQPYDVEVGAGTMAPETFLRVLGPRPYKVAYVQPSRRPADGRYGENPNRLYKHTQLQVILKPPPENVQELYLESLGAIGVNLRQHDIKFEEDNWEAPTLSAWGVGWQVMLDGLEITQFTYFQQCGGIDLDPISAELTYGLERITAFLQDVDSIYDIVWTRDPETGRVATYGDVRLAEEQQFSVYNFEAADVDKTWKHFELYEAECKGLLEGYASLNKTKDDGVAHRKNRFPVLAAYDLCLKCSHLFNILDARGAISVTERVGVIARVRALAVGIAKAWVNQERGETASEDEREPEQTPKVKKKLEVAPTAS